MHPEVAVLNGIKAFEGQISVNDLKEQNSQRPDVCCCGVEYGPAEDLRRGVCV